MGRVAHFSERGVLRRLRHGGGNRVERGESERRSSRRE